MKKHLPLLAALTFVSPLYIAMPIVASAEAPAPLSEGTIRKIDAENAKVTLRHGPLANLDMPPMTMVFRVEPPALLEGLKVGDTVKFHAEEINGTYTVTAIEKGGQ